MQIKRHEVEKEFLENHQVTVFLTKEESTALGDMIQSWYKINRHRNKHILLKYFYKFYDRYRWKKLTMKYFIKYEDASELFRFYIQYYGKQQIYIDAIDDISDQKMKQITFASRQLHNNALVRDASPYRAQRPTA